LSRNCIEPAAIFGDVDGVGLGTQNSTPAFASPLLA
jgi:hypothetical protein